MGFFRQFEIYARTRLDIIATFLNNHRMNFQEIREKSWSGGNGSALRAVTQVVARTLQTLALLLWFVNREIKQGQREQRRQKTMTILVE